MATRNLITVLLMAILGVLAQMPQWATAQPASGVRTSEPARQAPQGSRPRAVKRSVLWAL